MDLCNPTGDRIPMMYDSTPYIFEPRSVLTLPEDAGRHIADAGLKYGIVVVHFGDDPDKIRYSGLKARVLYYQQVLQGHRAMNQRQDELRFPAIVESDAVRQAKVALPIYEKALGNMEDKMGNEATLIYTKDLENLLSESTVKLPELKDASLTQMRDEASRVGVDWKPGWNYIELRQAIESAKSVAGMPRVGVPANAPSVAPPKAPEDELASSPFTNL